MNIEDLELTIRSHNGLTAAGITTVEQLVGLDWKQLNNIKNVGQKSISEICWNCIQVLNGRVTERRLDFEKRWPPRPHNWEELREKAKKYDAIAGIVGT
jgi:DNA-directed RNA polymerase alpha subunit